MLLVKNDSEMFRRCISYKINRKINTDKNQHLVTQIREILLVLNVGINVVIQYFKFILHTPYLNVTVTYLNLMQL